MVREFTVRVVHGFCKIATDSESIPCKNDGRLKEGRPGEGAIAFVDIVEPFNLAGNSTAMD